MKVRNAELGEAAFLARLWYEGWQSAHAAIVPEALARARTRESLAERMMAAIADVRTIGPIGAPLGFALLKGDEVNQLYVAGGARGAGVGTALNCRRRAAIVGPRHRNRVACLRHRERSGGGVL